MGELKKDLMVQSVSKRKDAVILYVGVDKGPVNADSTDDGNENLQVIGASDSMLSSAPVPVQCSKFKITE